MEPTPMEELQQQQPAAAAAATASPPRSPDAGKENAPSDANLKVCDASEKKVLETPQKVAKAASKELDGMGALTTFEFRNRQRII